MNDLSMLGQAALGYVKEGLAVFPLKPRSKEPFEGSHGFKDASKRESDIIRWWTNEPDANIGIATGAVSGGVFVVDIDDGHNDVSGSESLEAWEAENGELPETRESVTGTGGRHLFYRCPPGVAVKSGTGIIPSVDLRGTGGYVVAPPSTHPNGNMYAWEDWAADIATADDTVMQLVKSGRDSESSAFVLPDVIHKGERVDTLFRYAASLSSRGLPDEFIIKAVSDANKARCEPQPLSADELRKEVLNGALKLPDERKREVDTEVTAAIVRGRNNAPVPSIANCVKVLEEDSNLAGHFRYNEFAYQKEIICPVPWDTSEGARAVSDVDYINFAKFLEDSYGFTRIKNMATDALISVCDATRVNPVTEWLDSLKWDGEERVRFLPGLLGCDDTEYNTAVIWLTMLGAVTRAYEPGCKFDYMTVLVGAQGIGKSQFVRLLAHNPEWTTDNFNTISGDDAIEKIRGLWIAEMAELLATKRAKEIESVKAFITSQVDVIRPKYGRETQRRPRRCIFIGTTNDINFLTDTTGNRRFLPLECKQDAQLVDPMLFDDSMADYIGQAWAEVVQRYKSEHPKLQLPRHIEAQAQRMREAYTEEQPLVGIITKYLEDRQHLTRQGGIDERVCVREIIENCIPEDYKHTNTKQLQNAVIVTMNQVADWVRAPEKMKTRKYGAQRVWVPNVQKNVQNLS